MGVVYKITNLTNDKIYVGQTISSLKTRFRAHSNADTAIGRAIRKYGKKNFKIEAVEECETQKELNEREIFWIKKFNSKPPNGYNLTDGGKKGGGKIVSAETRKKMSEARMGKSPVNKGKKASDEARANMSAAQKRRYENPEERKKLSELNKGRIPAINGKKHTTEARAKMSAAQKKRYENPEERKKLSELNKGRSPAINGKKHTAEARAKMSAAQKKRYENPEEHKKMSESRKGKKRSAESRSKMSEGHRKIVYPLVDKELKCRCLTCKELARQIDMNYSTLCHKLSGRKRLDLKTAEKIRDFLGVDMTIEELFAKN